MSEPLSIEVVPLPKEAVNQAIGNFSITTKLKKDTSAANEPNALVVTILGSGNFKSITEPDIKWSDNIYHFDATETDEIDRLNFPLTGKKIFEIPFEVIATGKINIPAVSLRFFDPSNGKLQTVHSDSLQLVVTPAVKTGVQSTAIAGSTGFNIKLLLYLIPLAFIIGALIIWRKPKKKLQPVTEVHEMETEAVVAREMNVQGGYNDLLLVQGDSEFYIQAGIFAKELIASGKGDKDVLLQVVKDCNTMLYTPLPTTSKKEVLEKLQQAIN
jgi:hypothetical protein